MVSRKTEVLQSSQYVKERAALWHAEPSPPYTSRASKLVVSRLLAKSK